MKKLFKRLKCLFGFHEYTFIETPFGARHYCIHCGYWEEIKEWKEYLKRRKKADKKKRNNFGSTKSD